MDSIQRCRQNAPNKYGSKKKKLVIQERAKSRPDLVILRNQAKSHPFYSSPAWLRARFKVLKASSGACQLCGASGLNVRLHVDHIKPRSKYPDLALELSNLQVLCEACNLGKGNSDDTDWRKRKATS